MEKGSKNITAGQQLGQLVNGRIIPAIAELRARWDRLYPAVRDSKRPDVFVCRGCGHRVESSLIDGGAYQIRTVAGRHFGHPDLDSPDEFVTLCPDCGATESFGEVAHAE